MIVFAILLVVVMFGCLQYEINCLKKRDEKRQDEIRCLKYDADEMDRIVEDMRVRSERWGKR